MPHVISYGVQTYQGTVKWNVKLLTVIAQNAARSDKSANYVDLWPQASRLCVLIFGWVCPCARR